MADTPNKKKPRGLGRVRFLAHVESIRAQLEQGWPKTAIHDKMSAELAMSYPQFLRYVREYTPRSGPRPVPASRDGRSHPASPASPPARTSGVAEAARQEPRQESRQAPRPRGFAFDPMAVDSKDLI